MSKENEEEFELVTRPDSKESKLRKQGEYKKKIIDEAKSVAARVKEIVDEKKAALEKEEKPPKVVEINPELKEPDINENISLTVRRVILEKSLNEQQNLHETPLVIPAIATSPQWGPALWATLAGAGIYGAHAMSKLKGSKVEYPAWLKGLLKGQRWQPVSKETAKKPTLITPLSQRQRTQTVIPDSKVQQQSATKIQQPSASSTVTSSTSVVGSQSNITGRKIDPLAPGAFSGLTKGKMSTPEVSVSKQASDASIKAAATKATEGKKEQEKFARQAASMAYGQKVTGAEAAAKKEQEKFVRQAASMAYGKQQSDSEAAVKKAAATVKQRAAASAKANTLAAFSPLPPGTIPKPGEKPEAIPAPGVKPDAIPAPGSPGIDVKPGVIPVPGAPGIGVKPEIKPGTISVPGAKTGTKIGSGVKTGVATGVVAGTTAKIVKDVLTKSKTGTKTRERSGGSKKKKRGMIAGIPSSGTGGKSSASSSGGHVRTHMHMAKSYISRLNTEENVEENLELKWDSNLNPLLGLTNLIKKYGPSALETIKKIDSNKKRWEPSSEENSLPTKTTTPLNKTRTKTKFKKD